MTEYVKNQCPLCRNEVRESAYPRHRIVLEDESPEAPNQRSEARLCTECWETIHSKTSSVKVT